MPDYEAQIDGKKYRVHFDKPPAAEDFERAVSEFRSARTSSQQRTSPQPAARTSVSARQTPSSPPVAPVDRSRQEILNAGFEPVRSKSPRGKDIWAPGARIAGADAAEALQADKERRASNREQAAAEENAAVGTNDFGAMLTDIAHKGVRLFHAGVTSPLTTGHFGNPAEESSYLFPSALEATPRGFGSGVAQGMVHTAADLPTLGLMGLALRGAPAGRVNPAADSGLMTTQGSAQIMGQFVGQSLDQARSGDWGGALVNAALLPVLGYLMHGAGKPTMERMRAGKMTPSDMQIVESHIAGMRNGALRQAQAQQMFAAKLDAAAKHAESLQAPTLARTRTSEAVRTSEQAKKNARAAQEQAKRTADQPPATGATDKRAGSSMPAPATKKPYSGPAADIDRPTGAGVAAVLDQYGRPVRRGAASAKVQTQEAGAPAHDAEPPVRTPAARGAGRGEAQATSGQAGQAKAQETAPRVKLTAGFAGDTFKSTEQRQAFADALNKADPAIGAKLEGEGRNAHVTASADWAERMQAGSKARAAADTPQREPRPQSAREKVIADEPVAAKPDEPKKPDIFADEDPGAVPAGDDLHSIYVGKYQGPEEAALNEHLPTETHQTSHAIARKYISDAWARATAIRTKLNAAAWSLTPNHDNPEYSPAKARGVIEDITGVKVTTADQAWRLIKGPVDGKGYVSEMVDAVHDGIMGTIAQLKDHPDEPPASAGPPAVPPGPPPKTDGNTANDLQALLDKKYPHVKSDVYVNRSTGDISISRVVVPKEGRGAGVGTAFMQDVIDHADRTGARVTLTPSTDFGGSGVARLKEFYKRFGFVENSGRNKNFSVSDTMYREPKQGGPAAANPTDGAAAKPATRNQDQTAYMVEQQRLFGGAKPYEWHLDALSRLLRRDITSFDDMKAPDWRSAKKLLPHLDTLFKKKVENPTPADPTPPASSRLDATLQSNLEALKDIGKGKTGSGLEALGELGLRMAYHGALLLSKGIVDSATWTASMVKQFGAAVKPHLADLRAKAEALGKEPHTAGISNNFAILDKLKNATGERAMSQKATAEKDLAELMEKASAARAKSKAIPASKLGVFDPEALKARVQAAMAEKAAGKATGDPYAGQQPTYTRNAIKNLRTNVLTAFRTLEKVSGSHAIFMAAEELARYPAAGLDMFMDTKIGQKIIASERGRTTTVGTPKEVASAMKMAAVQGAVDAAKILAYGEKAAVKKGMKPIGGSWNSIAETPESAPVGLAAFKEATGMRAKGLMSVFDRSKPFKQRMSEAHTAYNASGALWADAYAEIVGRGHGAAYRPNKIYAYQRAIQNQMRLAGTKEASPAMVMNAMDAADVATLMNDNQFNTWLTQTKKEHPTFANAADFFAPIQKVPVNLAARSAEYVGLGTVEHVRQIAMQRIAGEVMSSQERANFVRTFGRASTGLGLATLGMYLVKKKMAVGYAKDWKDREARAAAGIPRGPAVKLGGRWWEIQPFLPIATPMIMGITVGQNEDDRPEWREVLNQSLQEIPYFRSSSDISGGLTEKGGMTRAIGNEAGRLVPTLAGDIAAQLDTNERKKSSIPDYIWDRVPGLRSKLKARDALETNKLFDPLNSRPVTPQSEWWTPAQSGQRTYHPRTH